MSATAFNVARAYAQWTISSVNAQTTADSAELEGQLRSRRRSKNILAFLGFAVAHKPQLDMSPGYLHICNELVAGLTVARTSSSKEMKR